MKALLSATVLSAFLASTAYASQIETVVCPSQLGAQRIVIEAMKAPTLTAGADTSGVLLAVVHGGCSQVTYTGYEAEIVKSAARYAHPSGDGTAGFGIIRIGNKWVVAFDFQPFGPEVDPTKTSGTAN